MRTLARGVGIVDLGNLELGAEALQTDLQVRLDVGIIGLAGEALQLERVLLVVEEVITA